MLWSKPSGNTGTSTGFRWHCLSLLILLVLRIVVLHYADVGVMSIHPHVHVRRILSPAYSKERARASARERKKGVGAGYQT